MQNKVLELVELILLRGNYARIQYRRTFLGVNDIAKVTQSVLEYKMLIRTHHAGIK